MKFSANIQPKRENQKPKAYSQGVGKYIKPEIKIAIKKVAEKVILIFII
jgi:hypothetical protein